MRVHKKSYNFLCYLLLFLANPINTWAQDDAPIDALIDRFLPDVEEIIPGEEIDYEAMFDLQYQYYQNPLNLNKVDRQALSDLQLLDENQLGAFFDYRKQFGKFISITELQAIPGFDPATIRSLLPFVKITDRQGSQSFWKRLKEEKNKYFFVRYQTTPELKKGYIAHPENENRYLGDASKLLYRLRISHTKDFSLGFTLEKDAGEPLQWSEKHKAYLADFVSWHYARYNLGRLKAVNLGDYQLQIGQGLLLAGGFQLGKGAETVQSLRRSTRGILPFTSAAEFGYLRGVATSIRVAPNTVFTSFLSHKNLTANRQLDSLGNSFVSSISTTGLHRTETERERKNALREITAGYHLNYKLPFLEVGTTGLITKYNLHIQRNASDYNQFAFNGDRLLNLGVNYSFYLDNFSFFGEAALSDGNYLGLISGVLVGLGNKSELAFAYRNYHRSFHSLYGNAISEGTTANNEQGFYWGIKLKPIKKWELAAYYDRFNFPWLRFQADAPSSGYEYLGRITYKPNKKLVYYLQYRYENRDRNLKDNDTPLDILVPVTRTDWRANLDFKAGELFSIKSRLQYSQRKQGDLQSEGVALMQDVVCDIQRFRIAARIAIFDTDDFDTRQYAYEKDVLYAFSIPAYYGEGIRNYLLIKWKASRKLDFWARYAITRWYDRDTIGSGLEEIEGNRRSEIKLQVRCRF